MTLQLRRYQRGYVYKTGKRIKAWYGRWREDVRHADGTVSRRQRNEMLGTLAELPTRSAAYEELSRRMALSTRPGVEMKFSELVERWNSAAAATIKGTTVAFYRRHLKANLIPAFGAREISTIGRYDVESFLASKAGAYCRNTLRGMRVSLGKVMSWAVLCGWLEKNPCSGVKLPQARSRITRTILRPEQTLAIASKLVEPYSTLVLFLAVTGLRVGEAVGIKWSDFDGDVLRVRRRIYEGKADTTKTGKSQRDLPIPASLLSRMRSLGGSDWVFRSCADTPANPGNALKRYLRPAARELGIPIGGWHDFRHTLGTKLRKCGWSAKVRADILGHSSLQTTEGTYDHADQEDFRSALTEIADELFRSVPKTAAVN
jgi:integrase